MFARQKYLCCVATAAMGFLLSPGATWAQSQSDSAQSVAEAARRAREQKKEKPKPARTFTNDDIPPTSPGIAGKEPAEANGAIKPSPEESAAVGKKDTEEKAPAPANDEQAKQKKAENAAALERAKKLLAQSESELDVAQRKALLDNESYYSKPDFANDKDGKANLDAEAQQIDDKKKAVEELKARVAELQQLVDETGEAEPEKNAPPENNPPSR